MRCQPQEKKSPYDFVMFEQLFRLRPARAGNALAQRWGTLFLNEIAAFASLG